MKLLLICWVLLTGINCGNYNEIKKTNVTFGELFSVDCFDSAIVNFGNLGDSTEFITTFNFGPAKKSIVNAKQSSMKMLWKGSFITTFTNNIKIEVSFYECFFKECSTGKLFIVREENSQEFSAFMQKMFQSIGQKRRIESRLELMRESHK